MHPQAVFLAKMSEPLLPIITFAEPGWLRDSAPDIRPWVQRHVLRPMGSQLTEYLQTS